jgi:hypothetical protein
MNATPANVFRNNNKVLNSLIPVPIANAVNSMNSKVSNVTGFQAPPVTGIVIFVVLVGALLGVLIYFKDAIQEAWKSAGDAIANALGQNPEPQPAPVTKPAPQTGEQPGQANEQQDLVEKVIPGGSKEVFSVSSNNYTFYDAEPLCRALGAELATYDQVKEAWNRGADWCNYGWVKGQMAVYPTSDDTYSKLQAGPEEQRMACGRPGVNGGYFDNPELRFGVTCYGSKPTQSKHDEREATKGAPLSPGALAFDKKVNQYKTLADTIGVLPFNTNKWSS